MYWLETNWLPYAERMGCHVLKGDMVHIRNHLPRVRVDRQKRVMKEYVRIWVENAIPYDGLYGDETSRFNQNKGRFAANQYILTL